MLWSHVTSVLFLEASVLQSLGDAPAVRTSVWGEFLHLCTGLSDLRGLPGNVFARALKRCSFYTWRCGIAGFTCLVSSLESNSLVFTVPSGFMVREQEVPGAIQSVGLMEEGCAGGCQYEPSLLGQMAVQRHEVSHPQCFSVPRNEAHCLGFVGRVLLLLNAARDAGKEVPQASGCMKLNWLSD